MSRVLIQFAHPALEKSRVNRRLAEAVQDLPGVTFSDLYEKYPDFDIDIEAEQALLVEHDILVLQHPFFWYSTPAMIKEWFDLVLEHGWAYGREGAQLKGKMALNAITTGGRDTAYRRGGHNQYTMGEFLAPIEQTFKLCGVEYLPPFLVHGTHGMTTESITEHAKRYRRVVEALRDDRFDLQAMQKDPYREWQLGDLLPDIEEAS